MTDREIKRVAIVGCGVAGLAMAACLKAVPTGVEEVVIFDPHDEIMQRNMGGAIGITSGAYILEKIGCLEALERYGKIVHKFQFLSLTEEPLFELDLRKPLRDTGYSFPGNRETPLAYTIRWSALRKMLYDRAFLKRMQQEARVSIEASVPSQGEEDESRMMKIIYRPKYRFESLQEDPETGKVTLFFSNRMHEGDFDLVIGADGVKSSVRKFTALPNETILTALPLGGLLPGAFGVQDTGLRVTQCISPPIYEKGEFKAAAGKENLTEQELLDAAQCMTDGKMIQHCGNGCNVLTLRIGDFENTYYVMGIIYREFSFSNRRDVNVSWVPDKSVKDEVEERLVNARVAKKRELLGMLQAATMPGGLIFDVSIQDSVLPLRTWASASGRVILIGDSAHATSPFLGQGANQAIQDAFCLTSLIYKHNTNRELALRREIMTKPTPPSASFLSRLLWFFLPIFFPCVALIGAISRAVSACHWVSHLLLNLTLVRAWRPTKMQRMAYEYESTRKHHMALLTIGARLLGIVEALGGEWGVWIKCNFFRMLHWTGLGRWTFLTPMAPVV